MKHYLVKHIICCGEYEFSGHTVISLEPRQQIKAAVHEYFCDYYGEENLDEANQLDSYLYNGGEVGCDHISWQPLSESDAEVLKALNI